MDADTAIAQLSARIDGANDLLERSGWEGFTRWWTSSKLTLQHVYSSDHDLVEQFDDIRYSLMAYTSSTPDSAWDKAKGSGIRQPIGLLEAAVEERQTLASLVEEE